MKYWPIAAAGVAVLVGFGALTSVVAEMEKTNNKQDEAIQRIIDTQKEQAETNGQLKADSKSTKEDVKQILDILLERKALGPPR